MILLGKGMALLTFVRPFIVCISLLFLTVGFDATWAESSLTLLDATFTEGVSSRQPHNRVTSFPLAGRNGQSRLWFWFKIHCPDLCRDDGALSLKIPIMVKWAYKEQDMFVVKRTVRLTVENTNWRTWAYKQHLKPGTWRVVIFSDQGPICLKEQCHFEVEVTE